MAVLSSWSLFFSCVILLIVFLLLAIAATPSQPLISGPPSRVTSGTLATFKCTSDGFASQDIKVKWFKDRRSISNTSPTIVLVKGEGTSYQASKYVKVRITDKDVKSQLSCQIKHSTLKRSLRKMFRLGDILRVPPRVRLETSPPLPIALNFFASVTCSVESFYPNDTSLVWLVNGKKTKRGKASPVTQNPAGMFSFNSSLQVFATEQTNQTVYTCMVVHDSQPPVTEVLILEVEVQLGNKDLWLFANPGLWIGLSLSKVVGALFLAYLFLRKEGGKITLGPTASPT